MRPLSAKFLCLVLTACLVLELAGCGKKKQRPGSNKVIRVSTALMIERNFCQRIPVQGTVWPIQFAVLSSRTEGTLDVLNVDEGSVVKKGDLLFQIDRQTLLNRVTVAQRELEVSESEVKTARIELNLADIKKKKAKVDYERADTLRQSNAVSQESFETAELAYKEAEAEYTKSASLLRIAEAQAEKQRNNLSIARKNLADSEIRAPFDGIITDKYVECGEFVKGGTQIIRLENQRNLEVICMISAIHYNTIHQNKTRAVFSIDKRPAGEALVTYRAPNVDPLSRTFKIKITLPKDTRLVSGLMCTVDLIVKERRGFGLPSDAIQIRGENTQVVFSVKNDGTAWQVVVRPGITDGKFTELLGIERLKKRKFVVRGQTFISPGDKLSILKELDLSCF